MVIEYVLSVTVYGLKILASLFDLRGQPVFGNPAERDVG